MKMNKKITLTILTIVILTSLITCINADNTTTETYIEMADNSTFINPTIVKDWNTTPNFNTAGLEPGKTYYFRAKSRNGDGVETAWSSTISKTTIPATPGAPNLEVTGIDSINITWTSIEGANQYILYRDGLEIYRGSELAYQDSELSKNKEYGYTLKSGNTSGESGLSLQAKAFTHADNPTNLNVTEITNTSIALIWEANGNPEGTAYELVRNGDEATPIYTGTELSYTDNTTIPGNMYSYKVRAINGDDIKSAYSNETTCRINTAPTLVELKNIEINSISVNWDKSGNPNGTEYTVSLFKADNTQVGEEKIYIQTDNENIITFSGLTENEQYYAKVRTKVSESIYTEYTQSLLKYTLANIPSIELNNATQDIIEGIIKYEPPSGL